MVVAGLLAAYSRILPAQTVVPADSVLPALRRAASMLPGEPPQAVRFLAFRRARVRAGDMVDVAGGDSVTAGNVAFQIAYGRGWIMVDAGFDQELLGRLPGYSPATYDQVQQALRRARLIVVTHEHSDHVAGVIRSPFAAELASKTLLTHAQVRTLLERPDQREIQLDSARAARFLQVDYAPMLPIAPGVVLLKAAGHTPGSQMVYVRLATGREVLLIGDVAWLMAGVERQRQKPEPVSRSLGEDRAAVGAQLAWLQRVAAAGVVVVAAHDATWLAELERRGVLRAGLHVRP